jgi:hypothetical protein
MAESKSAHFPFQIKAHSVKDDEFDPLSIKSLADHTECQEVRLIKRHGIEFPMTFKPRQSGNTDGGPKVAL